MEMRCQEMETDPLRGTPKPKHGQCLRVCTCIIATASCQFTVHDPWFCCRTEKTKAAIYPVIKTLFCPGLGPILQRGSSCTRGKVTMVRVSFLMNFKFN